MTINKDKTRLVWVLILLASIMYFIPRGRDNKNINPFLAPLVQDFKVHCVKYGWDPNHVDNINTIDFIPAALMNSYRVHGFCNKDKGVIGISYELVDEGDWYGIRHTLYHELGHWYGLTHSEGGIMGKAYSLRFYYSEFYEHMGFEFSERYWEHQVMRMMLTN